MEAYTPLVASLRLQAQAGTIAPANKLRLTELMRLRDMFAKTIRATFKVVS